MLHDIIVEKLVQEKYLSFDLLSIIRQVKKKRGGLRFLTGRTQRGGGGHSDAYCVQQGGWGGLKIGKKCVCN